MVTVEDFSRVVAAIYAASVTPRGWEPTLREINRTIDGTAGAVLLGDDATWLHENCTLPAEATSSYREYYHRLDRVVTSVNRGPVGLVRTGTELMPLVQKSEFYEDWLRPLEIDDGLFIRLAGDQESRCLIVAAPRRSQLDTAERIKFLSALVIHLQQALRTGRELGALATHSADLAYALDVMTRGVAIVGPGYCLTAVNSAAEVILRAEDGLRLRSGQLAATSACTEHKLYRALYVALTGGGSDARTGQTFTCERPSGKRPYVIHVMPLHSGRTEQERTPSALMLFVDPDQEPEPAAPLLRRLYGLTRSEAEVALHIMRGADVKQISDELCISAATVRTHLQHIFEKTDTHRQTDLVRLLLSLSI